MLFKSAFNMEKTCLTFFFLSILNFNDLACVLLLQCQISVAKVLQKCPNPVGMLFGLFQKDLKQENIM